MGDDPTTDAPKPADEQDAPAAERPAQDSDLQPSQAEGGDDDEHGD